MLSAEDKKKLKTYIEQYKKDGRSDAKDAYRLLINYITSKDPIEAAQIKSRYGYKDCKMTNNYMKFIDSVVGNIARKIEDEFNENDHPRDKGGKFTSAGKESRNASGMYGGEKVKKEDPKKGDALNEHAVKLEKAGADPKEIHRLNREGDLEGMKKLLEETETEKAAKEELGEASEFDSDEEEQDTASETETIRKELRRNVSTHVEDLVEYAKDDGYEAELESEEYMIVRKDGKEYRAHIDRAGNSYYVDRVEDL